jgi:hypothetical protein
MPELSTRRVGRDACACSPGAPCGLHAKEHLVHPFTCKSCHVRVVAVMPPDGWIRVQQQRDGRRWATWVLYCSPECLLDGVARHLGRPHLEVAR